jgi:hypothetical protein
MSGHPDQLKGHLRSWRVASSYAIQERSTAVAMGRQLCVELPGQPLERLKRLGVGAGSHAVTGSAVQLPVTKRGWLTAITQVPSPGAQAARS